MERNLCHSLPSGRLVCWGNPEEKSGSHLHPAPRGGNGVLFGLLQRAELAHVHRLCVVPEHLQRREEELRKAHGCRTRRTQIQAGAGGGFAATLIPGLLYVAAFAAPAHHSPDADAGSSFPSEAADYKRPSAPPRNENPSSSLSPPEQAAWISSKPHKYRSCARCRC